LALNKEPGGSVLYLSSNPALKTTYFEAYLAYYERMQNSGHA
jgi:hypothetical protein